MGPGVRGGRPGSEQGRQMKTKETKTHSNGKRLNIVCGVTIVPDIFLSIINSYGGIDDVRKQRLWPAVKRDLKIKYPSSASSNQLTRIYDDYESRGMFNIIDIDDSVSITSNDDDNNSKHSWSALPLASPISSSLSIGSAPMPLITNYILYCFFVFIWACFNTRTVV